MRALIWADLHGHNYKEFSTAEDGTNTRLKDCADVIGKILLSAKEEKVDEVWFVGDLFQLKNNLDNKVIQTIMREMGNLASNFPVIVVPGNHDYRSWTSEPILLEILEEFPGDIYVCEGGQWRGDVFRVYTEPFTRKIKELNERIAELKTNPEQDIFFGHQDIIGQRYGGFVVEHGLDANVLSKKFKWSFIGHWHQPAEIRENVVSVGAPLQHNFGDVRTEWDKANRGWWILDTEKAISLKFVPNISSPEFVDYIWDPNVEEKDFIPGDWEKDFYRLKVIGHAELPERLKRIKWKRVSYEIKGQVKKRTTISFSDKKEDVIQKYVELRGGNLDHKKLIEIGRKYL